ncbi:MATE family efflux transporter [Aestuariibacter sp. AA17]|uniref:MATE family efflux transporter n=1 Tax=Fluctibacter corallii TaxID=2984329 RepID=A0ABT3AC32_9ALTE|nr:MATE family efflux transporter [Aestuariibacter sp. AA17]MCV2885832.1 MATE family efflux transporter [Aestuariibacter sp. AA17]
MVKLFSSVATFLDKKEHLRLLSLTFPMILANITTPLIGLVDTAVMGHLPASHFLAGAAIGALILTQLYWVCGFIRMSATGLSAQAKGQSNLDEAGRVLVQNAAIGLMIGALVVMLQSPLLSLGLYFADAQGELLTSVSQYFYVRVWGAPAALINLALIGWLIGRQCTRQVLIIQIVGNLINAVLDVVFVFYLDMQVEGVALASVIAEYSILVLSIVCIIQRIPAMPFSYKWLQPNAFTQVFTLNTDMLIRNLALQACLAFVTYQGARLGTQIAAVNAILMQFFVLIALGLDAIAYAVEALVGEAKGQKDLNRVKLDTYRGLWWSSCFAALYALTFYCWGEEIVRVLTDQQALQQASTEYLPFIIVLPLVAHWCFLYDGVYIGLTHAKTMRNSMVISAVLVFFPLWWLTESLENVGLWISLLGLMLARGLTLGVDFYRRTVSGKF